MDPSVVDMSNTLSQTDQLIRQLLTDDRELRDERFLAKLQELRREHKKTLTVIEDLYREKLAEKRIESGKSVGLWPSSNISGLLPDEVRDAYAKAIREKYSDFGAGSDSDSDELVSICGSFITDPFVFIDETGWDTLSLENVLRSARESLLDELEAVDNYVDLAESERNRKKSPDKATWAPKITVPEPFGMTVRDETGPIRANFAKRFVEELLKAQQADQLVNEAKKFKAKPVPATTYLPLYEEILRKTESRRKFLREYCKEILHQQQKPFNFTSGKKYGHSRRCSSMDNLSNPAESEFRATPVPRHILTAEFSDSLKLEENQRRNQRSDRAKTLLETSTLPANMQVDRSGFQEILKKHRHRCIDKFSHSPKIKRTVPDFGYLHNEFEKNLLNAKDNNRTTIPQPFNMPVGSRPHDSQHSRTEMHRKEVKKHHNTLRRSRSLSGLNHNNNTTPVRHNTAANVRIESLQRQLMSMQDENIQFERHLERQKELEKEYRDKIHRKLNAETVEKNLKLKAKEEAMRDAERNRKIEYAKLLEEINDKVSNRPTVLERQQLLVKKQSIEHRYRKALLNAGIHQPILNNQSQLEVEEKLNLADAESHRSSQRKSSPAATYSSIKSQSSKQSSRKSRKTSVSSDSSSDRESSKKSAKSTTSISSSSKAEPKSTAQEDSITSNSRSVGSAKLSDAK